MMIDDVATGPTARLIPYPDTTERRLRRALRQLDAALADQRRAVAGLRVQLGALGGAVSALTGKAETLRDALAGAAAENARAHAASLVLLTTAERLEGAARR